MNSDVTPVLSDSRPWSLPEQLAWTMTEKALTQLSMQPIATDTSDATGSLHGLTALVSSTNRGQCAARLASLGAAVTLFEFEHYRFRMMSELLVDQDRMKLVCAADPPTDELYDVGILATRRDWGGELSRDLLQSFLKQLKPSGICIVVVDHPDDQWLGDQLREHCKQVRRQTLAGDFESHGATGYVVKAEDTRVRWREFECQFAFRDKGRLIQAVSRPGVFTHRRLDLGARRLIEAMELAPNQRILDIGCGSGVVAFTAAFRQPTSHVTAIDSNTRAIECTTKGALLNQISDQVTAFLSSDGSVPDGMAGSYDVVLTNPPYYANFQIAELFLESASRALHPGGIVWAVGKQPDWYQINVPRWFDRVKVTSVGGGYCIATGICPS